VRLDKLLKKLSMFITKRYEYIDYAALLMSYQTKDCLAGKK
jgi:hypothetical protein